MLLNFYGLFIVLGILSGVLLIEKLKKNLPISIFDLLPWVLIPGIIGARIYHVWDYWAYYSKRLIEIFYIWQGGMGIFGAIIGGIIGLLFFKKITDLDKGSKLNKKNNLTKEYKLSKKEFLNLLDLGVIGLSLGQAIGRWGNFFNQELYGLPTNLPWGIYIKPENRLPGFEKFQKFQPLFLYESIACLLIFFILLKIRALILRNKDKINKDKRNKETGIIFFSYLFLYSFTRFWLEFLRIESWLVKLPFSMELARVNQLVSLGLMIFSSFALLKKHATIKKVLTKN